MKLEEKFRFEDFANNFLLLEHIKKTYNIFKYVCLFLAAGCLIYISSRYYITRFANADKMYYMTNAIVQVFSIPLLIYSLKLYIRSRPLRGLLATLLITFRLLNDTLVYGITFIQTSIYLSDLRQLYKEVAFTLGKSVSFQNGHIKVWIIFLIIDFWFLIQFTAKKDLDSNVKPLKKAFIFIPILLVNFVNAKESEVYKLINRELSPTKLETLNLYDKYYEQALLENMEYQLSDKFLQSIEENENNVFLIQLESINEELVNQETTPKLMEIASTKGILIRNYQAASTNTTYNQEVFLCGILPTIKEALTTKQDFPHENMNCLPKILKEAGYTTIYMQGFDTSFADMDKFLPKIGYDYVYHINIFNEEDRQYDWGYDDKIAFLRFFETLERNHKDEKIFVHMEIGAINHFPFDTYLNTAAKKYAKTPLLKNENKDIANIMNSTYIQDKIMGDSLEKYYFSKYHDNSHLFIFGDHSWPIQKHKGNMYNFTNAWQENFVTSLAFVPAKTSSEQFAVGTEFEEPISNIWLKNTILNLLANNADNEKSFYPVLMGSNVERCILSVQPLSKKKIAIIEFPKKYIIDIEEETILKYDLLTDPEERKGENLGENTQLAKELIEECIS